MSGLDGPRLTYGGPAGEPVRSRRPAPWLTIVLLVVAIALAVAVVRLTVDGAGLQNAATAPAGTTSAPGSAPTSRGSAAPSPGVTTGTPTTSAVPVGDDAATTTVAPVGAVETASRFVAAWFDRDPKSRQKALALVGTDRLVGQLADTDPAKIPSASPEGSPTPVNVSTYSVEFVQSIGAGQALRLTLVADPVAGDGWLVDAVTPVS